ncbi:MAG: rRNA pseudouridine synthase [Actinobacteria bacterium]|nr:rRNA pseudouridine synthase [Actinomycetota bacterium]
MAQERLQKVLAAAGLGSRRKCETFITAGRVAVDGVVVDELGARVDPEVQVIHVDGVRIAQASGHVVFAFNKPRGMITTMSDPQGRPCVGDVLIGIEPRLFYIGRLDGDTEGLLLLTNDGELAQHLGHPSHEIAKTYVARVKGRLSNQTLQRIKSGIVIEGRAVDVRRASIKDQSADATLVELTIHEGRNRIVRRLFDEVNHPVLDLARVSVGPINLGNLKSGHMRELGPDELGRLYSAVGL